MIIALDIDGVLARLGEVWIQRYNKDYNDNVSWDDITEWATHKFVKPKCGTKIYDYLKDSKLYDEVQPYEDAYEVVTKLREDGNRVIFPTTTPIESAGAKYYWLQRNNLMPNDRDYIEVKDKTLVRADFLLDDNYNNYKTFPGIGVLRLQPWNEKLANEVDRVVLNLTDFYTHFNNLVF